MRPAATGSPYSHPRASTPRHAPDARPNESPRRMSAVPRSFRPDDLYRFRVATDPRLSPDGSRVVFTVQTVAPTKDGYRSALWSVAADGGGEPRQLTIGARHDHHALFSPDGRWLAFLSDRRIHVEEEPAAG